MAKRILLILAIVLALGTRPSAQTGSDLLAVLPDENGILIIDVQRVTGSDLWSTLGSHDKTRRIFDHLKSGLDMIGMKLTDISAMAVSFRGLTLNNFTAAISGTFSPNDLLSRLKSDARIKLSSEKYKSTDVYTVASSSPAGKDSHQVSFAFLDARTVVAGSAANVRLSVDVRAGEKSGISQNARLNAAMAEVPPAGIRFAILTPPSTAGAIQSSNIPLPDFSSVNLIFGTVDLNTGIDINATLRNGTPDQAKTIADQLNGLLGMAKGFLGSGSDPKAAPIVEALKTISITGTDVDVKIAGKLSREFFAQLIK